mmetsp:Transcript_2381/g.3127  ORF Transcript_2381/g.3127 Transcript_2381/m.3127 type:complete len:222 (+) Transcript_2381:2641-3306(+)
MNNSRTGIVSHISVTQNGKVIVAGKKVKQGFVLFTHQCLSLERLQNGINFLRFRGLPLLAIHLRIQLRQTTLRQHVLLLTLHILNLHILHSRMHAQREIANQRPRRRRPSQSLIIFPHHRKTHHHARILHILIIQPRLKIRQRRPTRRTKRHNLIPLINQPLLKQTRKHPPHALHKPQIHSLIIILKIDPSSQTLNRRFPFLRVSRHNTLARVVVLVNAHR